MATTSLHHGGQSLQGGWEMMLLMGERPWLNLPPSREMINLQPEDKLVDSGVFPVVWTCKEA